MGDFYQKSIFNLLNPFEIDYLNLWDIFRLIFRLIRMTFFHKIMVAEKKIIFLQIHNMILQKGKVISKCKDDKPWKN